MSFKQIVLCIPRMESNTKQDFIKKVLERVITGTSVTRMTEIPHKDNHAFKRVFIYMKISNNTKNAKNISILEERFSQRKDIKIIYDAPWYWKIVEASKG
jgi:hypothetical protein